MCGRYTLIKLSDLVAYFPWIGSPAIEPEARYNIAPGQPIAVVSNESAKPKIDYMRWGLVPAWAKDASISTGSRMINLRSETLTQKPTFNRLLKRRRCLIPADGFYEWKPTGPKSKAPYRFVLNSGRTFAFAGLWDHWMSPDGSEILTCTILTTAANELVKPIHDRMPVILKQEHVHPWVNPREMPAEEMEQMLGPCPAELMRAYPVSAKVGSPANDSADLIEPIDPPPTRPQQLPLFPTT